MYTYFLAGEDTSQRLRRISPVARCSSQRGSSQRSDSQRGGSQRHHGQTSAETKQIKSSAPMSPMNGGALSRSHLSESSDDEAEGHEDGEESSPKTNLLNGSAHFIVDFDTRESVL